MRQIGHLENESAARTFGDFLYVQGIKNQVEHEPEDGWVVWIHDEEHLSRAKELLVEFTANPNDPKFSERGRNAAKLREAEQKTQAAFEKKMKGRRHLFRPLDTYGIGPLTLALIAISVVVFILMQFGKSPERIMSLFITDYSTEGDFINWKKGLLEIRHGEIWRLLTPIFIHYTPTHILFNMLCLRDLGSMIEARQNSVILALLVVVIGVCSNFGQYLVGGPAFGGMSGVVYGLLGYIWMRGKFDPGSGLFLHPITVGMMIVWYFLCLTGLLGHIANTDHSVGLVMGMAWGWLSSLRYR